MDSLFSTPSSICYLKTFTFLLYLFIFGRAGFSLLLHGLSLVAASGGCSQVAVVRLLFGVASLEQIGLCRGSCAQAELLHVAELLRATRDLLRAGIQPVSLALQGGFLTTGPPVLEAPISFCFITPWSLRTFSDPSVYLNVDMYSLYVADTSSVEPWVFWCLVFLVTHSGWHF